MVSLWYLWFLRGLVLILIPATYLAHRDFAKKRDYAEAIGDAPTSVQESSQWRTANALAKDEENKARVLRDILAYSTIVLLLLSFWLG